MIERLRKLLGVLRRPMVAIGVLGTVLALVVGGLVRWFSGNWLAAIIVGLAVLLIVLVFALVRALLVTERSERRERGIDDDAGFAESQQQQDVHGFAGSLEESFRRGFAELQNSRVGGDLYSLPWVLVVGETGAGKSEALWRANLDIPAEFARGGGRGPTADIDWVFTNDGVFLDTSGRFLSPDDAGVEKGWKRLLQLLRRQRKQLPINGIIVALSAERLCESDPRSLEMTANHLRRRLNDIGDQVGVDAPVYLMVTQCDRIEGYRDFADAVPRNLLNEAIGWTNSERRFADAGDLALRGIDTMRQHLDRVTPELVMRAPDEASGRRLFLFPQELEEVGRAAAALVRRAFAPTVYGETPFLRGIYFTSAESGGSTFSPVMKRLGQTHRGSSSAGRGGERALFLRDVMREIVIGDDEVALRISRFGPRTRRLAMGVAAAAALACVGWWMFGAVSGAQAIGSIAQESRFLLQSSSRIGAHDTLRKVVEVPETWSVWQSAGLGAPIRRATKRGRNVFLWAFEKEFEQPTKERLLRNASSLGDSTFGALAELARDLSWMEARATGEDAMRPELAAYSSVPRDELDQQAFRDSYDAWIRWSPPLALDERIERESEALARVASRVLEIRQLERWSASRPEAAIRYERVGLGPALPGTRGEVPGVYTLTLFESVVRVLLRGIEDSGSVEPRRLELFRNAYATRYDDGWRHFLLETPTPPKTEVEVKRSAYLDLIEQIDHNTRAEIPRAGTLPDWIGALREARREEALEEEEGAPPWTRYLASLEQVAADITATENSEDALDFALSMSKSGTSSFHRAADVVEDIVPVSGDRDERMKLRVLLMMPILDGLSALLDRASVEVDRRWEERVVSRFSGELTEAELAALYAPGSGALTSFRSDLLDSFWDDAKPKRILEDRSLRFGPEFETWIRSAEQVQSSLFPGSGPTPLVRARLRATQSQVLEGAQDLAVIRRELNMVCADNTERFVYREGSGNHNFRWTPDCTEVELAVFVERGGDEVELAPRKRWRGPLAFPAFLREAESEDWVFSYPEEGVRIRARYEIGSGEQLLALSHQAPPNSVRE